MKWGCVYFSLLSREQGEMGKKDYKKNNTNPSICQPCSQLPCSNLYTRIFSYFDLQHWNQYESIYPPQSTLSNSVLTMCKWTHRSIWWLYKSFTRFHIKTGRDVFVTVVLFPPTVNKQINDKERIAAAMENPNLKKIVEDCIEEEGWNCVKFTVFLS